MRLSHTNGGPHVWVHTRGRNAFLAVSFAVLLAFAPCPSKGQMIDYSDLTGLRTMANTPTTPQTGMEVENVNVPSLTEEGEKKEEELPEEEAAPGAIKVLFDTNKIDPDQYIIGADDVISVYMWDKLDKEYKLAVDPEGTLIIPTVGVVEVAGCTLTEAKERIRKEVFKKYKDIALSITLARPRVFRVFVFGIGSRSGPAGAHSLMRVSDVIGRVSPSSSQRRIVVHRGDKDLNVDLLLFRNFGDLSANPYVTAEDKIEVPPSLGNVYIFGNVNRAGRYEFKPGDRILDLVRYAFGLTPTADSARVTLARFEEEGKNVQYIDINLYDALLTNPDDPRYLLHEFDRLFVRNKFDFKKISNVEVIGEVKYSGTYAITTNEIKLSDVILMAGGFTDQANLEDALFIRPSVRGRDLEYARLSKIAVADMTDEEYDYFKNVSRSRTGEISIDFVKLFIEEGDISNDIVLQNGDRIYIPSKNNFVHVMGAVQQPGYLKIEPGADYSSYIQKAGGYHWNAKSSKTRIIKAQTGQQFKPSKRILIEGGDTINIPEKRPTDLWKFTMETMQVLANVATIVILARRY